MSLQHLQSVHTRPFSLKKSSTCMHVHVAFHICNEDYNISFMYIYHVMVGGSITLSATTKYIRTFTLLIDLHVNCLNPMNVEKNYKN